MSVVEKSLALAEKLQNTIAKKLSRQEQKFHHKMQKLLNNPKSKVMLIELLDKSFRTKDRSKNFELIHYILERHGIADFFTPTEKTLLFLFLNVGKFVPSLSVPFFVSQIRSDTKSMVLDANPDFLQSHITKRAEENITININFIGEEVLGEEEAHYRIQKYEEAIASSYITYISIKITTIFSQINIIDFEASKQEVIQRLKHLYALASKKEKESGLQKFINLDMEEFRDLELTVSAFMDAISDFKDLEAGIVLQAYIPDSYHYLQVLHEFSKKRVLEGGKPIKIRFVKGANMESEETIASQRGWELPTFEQKAQTDSNYKKMLDFILTGDNHKYIHIGIASHNIFEIAYAYTRITEKDALDSFTFEMLEGMSMQASQELSQMHKLILYAPVCDEAHFNNAIAYLVRRLDENTSSDNFMRYFFHLKVGDDNWEKQKNIFLQSIQGIKTLDNSTKRRQNRLQSKITPSTLQTKVFHNEPDTDFILPSNRKWAEQIKSKYENFEKITLYPVAGSELKTGQKILIKDKIHQKEIAEVYLADEEAIHKALQVAKNAPILSHEELHSLLAKTAQIMRDRRGDLIGIAALEVGKTFLEIDPEVSEAIDFLEFYPHSLSTLKAQNPTTQFHAKGIGATIAPWNFPIGIPVGTIAAPLAAGNKVIFKPSSLALLTGYKICECFWDAGFSKETLLYLPSHGSDISKFLLKNPLIDFCVFTGGEESAYKMLESNPTLLLSAETGGKNATIVTKMADRDAAIKNIIHSAFSNSGQKCSATSLLILEEEVYHDENFKKTLVDAAKSLSVGNPFVLKNKLGALADSINDKVKRAIRELEEGESWALEPRFIENHPYLMTPGIKYGVKEDSFMHQTELFAPILGVMCAKDLKDAIEISNATGYGLTSALESLDQREWEYYCTNIQAGNLYINKPTTGAIVLRQPFGGIKKSAIGFGRKVGIYNYITQFLHIHQEEIPEQYSSHPLEQALTAIAKEIPKETLEILKKMIGNFAHHYEQEFSQSKEYITIRGEDNLFSYTPIRNLIYRVSQEDRLIDVFGIIIASLIAKVPICVSFEHASPVIAQAKKVFWAVDFVEENLQSFLEKIHQFERIRYLSAPSQEDPIYQAAARIAKIIIRERVLLNGRFELLYYFNEKSTSISYHRYGNLGERILKEKK
ncbi:bifunctional proline dehydrogenase/L-glutamate gamma-semialdehyde dehydrogenase [Helicobacter mustelae]|nr:bifunctional proline dehydrogenase/L-glutamate gamma-semialdehyde dehydrogenase [Helicobacter mustelae]SQH70990.1 proline dehydrogenase [Helicobacter mustelae]